MDTLAAFIEDRCVLGEGLLERAARLGAEADASAVEEYRGCMAEAWAKIGRLELA